MQNYILEMLAAEMYAQAKHEKRAARRERERARKHEQKRREREEYAREFEREARRTFTECKQGRTQNKWRNTYSREQAGTIGLTTHGVRVSATAVVVCRSKIY